MLATIFTGTTRYRRQILAAAAVLAASLLWLRSLGAPQSTGAFALVMSLDLLMLVSFVLALLALLASSRSRPAALAVDPRGLAFRESPNAGFVYLVVGLIFVSATEIAHPLPSTDVRQDPHRHFTDLLAVSASVLDGLSIGLAAVLLVVLWRGFGVELRPDGLTDRTPLGTLTVPWDALAPGYPQPGPAGSFLLLTYARPELVRRSHVVFSRRHVSTHSVDPQFLSAVIAHYAAYPQYRPAIGTRAEYNRLLHALHSDAGPMPAWRSSRPGA